MHVSTKKPLLQNTHLAPFTSGQPKKRKESARRAGGQHSGDITAMLGGGTLWETNFPPYSCVQENNS